MTAIPLAPLQLDDYVVVNSMYAVRDVEGEPDGGLTVRFHTSGVRDGETVELRLTVWVNNGPPPDAEEEDAGRNNPHTALAEIVGRFRWIGDEREDQDRLIVVNGVSMLYGIARVVIAQASSAGSLERLILPAYSFANVEVDLDATDGDGVAPEEP